MQIEAPKPENAMLKLLPVQVQYANQINEQLRKRFGVTMQELHLPVTRAVDSHTQGWTPEQFVAWVEATQNVTPKGAN